MLLYILAYHGGPRGSSRRALLKWANVAVRRFKYWTWGGIKDASQIARRGDTASDEFTVGIVTLAVALWWAFIPQPTWSVFGTVNTVLPSILPGIYMALAGRNLIHQLVKGRIDARAGAIRWVFAAWAFLLVNQLLVTPYSVGTIIWLAACWKCYWIHGHFEAKARRAYKPNCARKGGEKETRNFDEPC